MDLTLSLTHACDLGCGYCFAGEKDARTLDAATGRAGLELAFDRAAAQREGLDVAFFGGEPLLRWELLLELADAAAEMSRARNVALRFSITTNGTQLTPERAKELDARGFHVAVSVDGVAAAQDAARPTAGGLPSSAKVERGLDAALAHVRSVATITVVDPLTVDLLEAGVAHLVQRGVRRLTLNPAWSSTWSPAALDAWRAAYEGIAAQWCDAHRASDPFWLSTIDPAVQARVYGARGGCGSACGFGLSELAVAPSGRLYACGRAIGTDPEEPAARHGWLGDVRGGVDPALLAELPKGDAPLPAECAVCALRDRCARGCGCSNRESSGDAATPGGLLCWHERMRIPIADRAAARLWAGRDPSFLHAFYGVQARRLPVCQEVLA